MQIDKLGHIGWIESLGTAISVCVTLSLFAQKAGSWIPDCLSHLIERVLLLFDRKW